LAAETLVAKFSKDSQKRNDRNAKREKRRVFVPPRNRDGNSIGRGRGNRRVEVGEESNTKRATEKFKRKRTN